ncbi:lipoprotein [Kitasatospora saccharophila]|uniref:Lipoprotein n=1 Tax=Kitasatospora saccharophila TaxID=407973 RepID=A0ABN2WY32_9ACTN
MRTNRLLAVTVLSVLGVTGLTACGSDGDKKGGAAPATSSAASTSASASTSPSASASAAGKGGGLEALSAEEILKKTRAAGEKLTSAKVTFKMADAEGNVSGSVAADSSGNCSGTFTIEGTGKAEILGTGGKRWIKPDAGFLKTIVPEGNTAAAGAMAGKWLTGDGAGVNGSDGFGWFCEVGIDAQRKAGLLENGAPDSSVAKNGTGQLDGVKTVLFTAKDEGSGAPLQVAVADEGEPYVISMKGDATGEIRFGDFGKPVTVTAPAAAQVFDMDTALSAG